ncbi:receptor-like protein 7 [Triticum dicoccoides]|uniref:receptor-like protein 7 n=1 Tax=Triticum dicoccoides TaxID=85692 RepID=UPI00188E0645|nr:receptor-like protein 7 [Triticum dicoccoides]
MCCVGVYNRVQVNHTNYNTQIEPAIAHCVGSFTHTSPPQLAMACPKPFHLLLLLLQLQLIAVNLLHRPEAAFTDHTPASPECLPDQASALLRLKRSFSATNHSTIAFRSWKAGTDCFRWEGVRCHGSTGCVSSLDLGDRGLESPNLDLSLFELTSLRYLNLAGNDFRMSEIPSIGFERLTKLTHLNLSATNFSGQVPRSIGRLTNLVSLDLSFRFEPSIGPFHVDGKFHADITRQGQLTLPNLTAILANMGGLRELHLGFVDLSSQGGEWCTALARYTLNLRVLSMPYCELTGPICGPIAGLQSLSVIDLQVATQSFDRSISGALC